MTDKTMPPTVWVDTLSYVAKNESFRGHEGYTRTDIHEIIRNERDDLSIALAHTTREAVRLKLICAEMADILTRISERPDIPNPDVNADWKSCMKWSSHEARLALASYNKFKEGK